MTPMIAMDRRAAGAGGEGAPRSQRERQGSILVEFALVSLAFYLLLAGTLELGRMITMSQILENAARAGARELALIELPATTTFAQAMANPQVKSRVYDPAKLAVPLPADIAVTTASWPIVNRMLVPLMVVDEIGGTSYLHYPGPIIQAPDGTLTVAVPKVTARDAAGHETIQWVPVLEEVLPDADPTHGPFSLASPGPAHGLVALRLNCPYQASSMVAYHDGPIDTTTPDNRPIEADDGAVHATNSIPGGGSVLSGGPAVGPYAGQFGLGKFYAMSKEVRPFRRLISAQSIFRREVFSQ